MIVDPSDIRTALNEVRRERRKLVEEKRRIIRKIERKKELAKQLYLQPLTDLIEPPSTMLVCRKCGIIGHMSTNTICPLNRK